MKYLSDKIYVTTAPTPSTGYTTYTVKDMANEGKVLFTGTFFDTGGYQDIYLNDIISSYSYKYDYMRNLPAVDTSGIYMNIAVGSQGSSELKENVKVLNSYFKKTDVPLHYIDMNNPDPVVYNELQLNTDLYPRIPKRLFTTTDSSFWFSAVLIFPYSYKGSTIDIYAKKENDAEPRLLYKADVKNNVCVVMVDGEMMNSIPVDYRYITAGDLHLATIDSCSAEYYLMWVDRSGAYQCQPFEKKCYHSEEIGSKTLVNLIDEERPYEKLIADRWELNSDWIGFEDQRTYESILASPYLYLYNTQTDIGLYVNCKDTHWDEYSRTNKKQPFKFTVNLEAASKQNIIY